MATGNTLAIKLAASTPSHPRSMMTRWAARRRALGELKSLHSETLLPTQLSRQRNDWGNFILILQEPNLTDKMAGGSLSLRVCRSFSDIGLFVPVKARIEL